MRRSYFTLLQDTVTENVVSKQFAHRRPTAVKRYVLPKLAAMNFVLDGVLDGGVTQALNLDSHGKTLSFRLLELSVPVPDELVKFARQNSVAQSSTARRLVCAAYLTAPPVMPAMKRSRKRL